MQARLIIVVVLLIAAAVNAGFMNKTVIYTPNAPKPIGPYSQVRATLTI